MNNMRMFPEVMVRRRGKAFEGVACLMLKSILRGDLIIPQQDLPVEPADKPAVLYVNWRQRATEALLHAVSSWPPDLTLELRLTALPNLAHKSRGRVWISIFLRSVLSAKDAVREQVIRGYLGLAPLLAACYPEAEFAPVTDPDEVKTRMRPFTATHAASVHRVCETLRLSEPLNTRRLSVGFGPVRQRENEPDCVVEHVFPWIPSGDDWLSLIDVLLWQLDPVSVIVRIRPGADTGDTLEKLSRTIQTCELFLSEARQFQITSTRQTNLLRDETIKRMSALRGNAFHLGVFVLAPHPIDPSIIHLLGKAVTGPSSEPDANALFRGGFRWAGVRPGEALKHDFFAEATPFTISEAACAFRLPHPPMEEHPGIPLRHFRTSPASVSDTHRPRGIALFVNEHHGTQQPIHLGVDDRMRHMFIIGQTGTGKSTLMETMIIQDIQAGRGLAVIDPHGELIDSLLGRIPPEREQDVILFDPLDRDRPLGFNILQWETPGEMDLIIDELYLTIDRIYNMEQTGGPIFESNFRGMLRLLMTAKSEDEFVPTVLEFNLCYLKDKFRSWLRRNTVDKGILDFVRELERTGGEASLNNLSPYITSKFSRFTNDSTLRRIVGQDKTSFDFSDIMNNGKILLMKLGKGRFGPNVSALLTSQVVSRFKHTAMKRGDMRPEERRDFFLYVDECHNLPTENFMELLSEARKFRMGLVLSTQYAAQIGNPLDSGNNLLAAILGNVGTTVMFRLGHDDARLLSPALYPCFTDLDIIGLPNWRGYVRMQLSGENAIPFSFATRKVDTPRDPDVARKIRDRSREVYGMDSDAVDRQILNRRNIWKKGL